MQSIRHRHRHGIGQLTNRRHNRGKHCHSFVNRDNKRNGTHTPLLTLPLELTRHPIWCVPTAKQALHPLRLHPLRLPPLHTHGHQINQIRNKTRHQNQPINQSTRRYHPATENSTPPYYPCYAQQLPHSHSHSHPASSSRAPSSDQSPWQACDRPSQP